MKAFKSIIFLIFSILIAPPIISQAASDWTVREIQELKAIYPNPDDIEIIDLEFQTENHGFLIAKASSGMTYVYRTSNGGTNWSQVFTPLTLWKYKDIVFDETGNFGVILYDETRIISGYPNFQTVLIQGVKVTTNGGTNWATRPFPGNHGKIWEVEARWPSYIWAAGEASTILYSSNYGQNWNPLSSPVANKTFGDIYVDPDDMVYGGGWGIILGSSRLYAPNAQYGGKWVDASSNIPWMDKVDFVMTNGVGIQSNGQTGTIYYSGYPPEGGVSPWRGATLPEQLVPSDVDMVTTWQGWVAGRNSFGKIEGKIYKTVNYGQTWSIDLEADDLLILLPNWTGYSALNTISMVNASVGYAAGDGYYLFKYRPCSLPVGHLDYCRDCGPCQPNQGDCDSTSECAPGLVCAQVPGTDVCEVPGGGCPPFVTGPDACTTACPCDEGQGDCDSDAECAAGLVCAQDVGANYGWPATRDVCEQPGGGCPPFVTGPDACTTACPCDEGQGDCDSDNQCAPGLVCAQDVGANYGWPATRDVCEQPGGGPCSVFQPGADWCRDCGPCAEGEGDCDSDNECQNGLVCAQDVGANYGWPATRDVCELPSGPGDCILDSKFQTGTVRVGASLYTDRAYTITGGIPDWMVGRTLIQTPNDERNNNNASGYIRFTAPVSYWVYVLFDSRSASIPNWLSGWERYTKYPDIQTSLATQPGLKMYRKLFDAGQCVDLGGNYGPGASSETRSNYVVVYGQ